jgi:hypothetical protein
MNENDRARGLALLKKGQSGVKLMTRNVRIDI